MYPNTRGRRSPFIVTGCMVMRMMMMMMMILIVSAAVAVVRGVGERNSARASDGRRGPSPLWGNMFSLLPRQPHPCPMGADSLSAHAHVLNHFPFASPVCARVSMANQRPRNPARVDSQSASWERLPAALLPAVCSQLTVVTGAESLLLLLLFWSFCTSVSGRDRGMIVWRSGCSPPSCIGLGSHSPLSPVCL